MTETNISSPVPLSSATEPLVSIGELENNDEFISRHIGPDDHQISTMLGVVGYDSLDNLVAATLPESIASRKPLRLPPPVSEASALGELKAIMSRDQPRRSFIGLGYYATRTPNVILRNVLESPGWYTAYTPYQPEISQGRLECLLSFQQMIIDLTGMDLANASLLDEATAAAEAMSMARRVSKHKKSNAFFVDHHCFPQTIDVVRTRAERFGFDLIVDSPDNIGDHSVFGALFQYPSMLGDIPDLTGPISALHEQGGVAVVAADLMSLVLLRPPGEMGADVVVGTSQRFGVPMGYGGPHAAFFAVKDEYKRAVPGRIIGVSVDSRGNRALRMALQTREQHIRRQKANSNICTAQVLLANIAALYAMYHGPSGLKRIASRIHRLTTILATGLRRKGARVITDTCFDTLTLSCNEKQAGEVVARAGHAGVNLRLHGEPHSLVGLSLDECSTVEEVETLWKVILGDAAKGLSVSAIDGEIRKLAVPAAIPGALRRRSRILQHANFNSYHSETEMLRYLKKLEDRDISLNRSMIALGSCTMKLNATAEMLPVTWPEFSEPHPFAPLDQVTGYQNMIRGLENMLAEITGFDAISMQPNSGAQGEYAGLLAIRKYLDSKGQQHRNVCLIPGSAHGTNPASAWMMGMTVVTVACDASGNIDVKDLRSKVDHYSQTLAGIMITYPSTHGVYEEAVTEVCRIIHDHGGQVYMDGANMNALVGVARPADIGADVAHVNLHKTFCIPHGGGGPGMGPIGVRKHLASFLPNHSVIKLAGPDKTNTSVSAAPWGSSSILPISWMYIRMMGARGLRRATQVAILNANYIARRLSEYYPVLYTGKNGLVAHECIIDLRAMKASTGITEEDVAKRLMDYGFHAPTMSFPVSGTLMIEPTESESLKEIDRFIDAMIGIRAEIAVIESGDMEVGESPLKRAPHTLADLVDERWDRKYTKSQAAFPFPDPGGNKYWPPVNRVDNAYGDKNLMCRFPDVDAQAPEQ